MRPCLLLAAVAAATLSTGEAAGAWSRKGHSVIALIAEQHLTPKTLSAVDALLATEGDASMVSVSSWADQIREDPTGPMPFHSATLPGDQRPYDGGRKMCHKNNCAVVAIQHDIDVLRDPDAGVPDKVVALKYLIHLVGDIHQPMHATSAGRGQMVNFRGRTMTLHQVWDSVVLTAHGGSFRSIAGRVETEADVSDAEDDSPVDWAEESRDVTRDRILVGTLKDAAGVETLPDDYPVENWPIARDRLMLAGLRLANTLNAIYDPR